MNIIRYIHFVLGAAFLIWMLDVTDWSMTNGESLVADGAVGPVHTVGTLVTGNHVLSLLLSSFL